MIDVATRRRAPELMDDPALDRLRHVQALRALRRVNRVSLAARRVWREVSRIQAARGGLIRVLDLACGGGDVVLDVARRARRSGFELHAHGADLSPVALEQARGAAGDLPGVDFFQLDARSDPIPADYDLITSSLFLHHLAEQDVIELLRRMAEATSYGLLVQDLRRTRLGYAFAWVGLHTLTRSDVARTDGLVSVRGAFTTAEVKELFTAAGLASAQIHSSWPQRFTVRWSHA